MDKLLKLSVIAAALMAGGGVFYHYVVFLPGIEQAKREKEEAQQAASTQKAAARQVAYERCKVAARINYDSNWASACTAVAAQAQTDYNHCLRDPAVMSNQFLGKAHCEKAYGQRDASPECSLPGRRSDSINAGYKDAQDKCLAEAKSGLAD